MAYNPNNANGNAVAANSAPVTLASDNNGPVKIYDGTTTVSANAGDSGYNGLATTSGGKTINFTTTGTGAQILGPYTTAGYSSINIQFSSPGTGVALTGQFSLDGGTTWNAVTTWQAVANTASVSQNITSTANLFRGPVCGPLFRLQYTAITAGASAGSIYLSNAPLTPTTQGVLATPTTTQAFNGDVVSPNVAAQAVYSTLSIWGGTNVERVRTASTAATTTGTGLLGVGNLTYNGSTWEANRLNTTGAIIAAGATTAQTSTTQVSYNAKKLHVVINVSAFTSGTLTFTINALTASGYTYPLLVSTALAATGITVLKIIPGGVATANLVANDMVPRSFNVVVSGTFVATYGVDFNLAV